MSGQSRSAFDVWIGGKCTILVMVESWTAGRPCAAQASRKHVRRVHARILDVMRSRVGKAVVKYQR
ncbi:hypothetical protein B5V03_22650 [Bradyrhizobium betae]|uniref:Uncharacterized protein n=2 Tax=Bradyrhizobium betae TaxID=244734 RepID=A0A4Q1UZG7_9BRAD|nr:hypothetical protein B5V03_22650 [Bradyrhizobium betae]